MRPSAASPHLPLTSSLLGPLSVLAALPFATFFLMAAAALFVQATPWLGVVGQSVLSLLVAVPYLLHVAAAAVVLSNPAIYVAWSAAGLMIATLGLTNTRLNWWSRGFAGVCLLMIAAFPLLYRYEPALAAAPGYRAMNVTQPAFLDGIVKRAAISMETQPCVYALLGWTENGLLYFEESCAGATHTYAFDPRKGTNLQDPPTLPLAATAVRRDVALRQVHSPGVWPTSAEPSARDLALKGDVVGSPDGQWVALISRHVYGPEDVLVLSALPAQSP